MSTGQDCCPTDRDKLRLFLQREILELLLTITMVDNTPIDAVNLTSRDANASADIIAIMSSHSQPPAPNQRLSAGAITLLMSPLCLSVFLSSLDLTVVTPAIPAMASSLPSSQDYVWIGSAFILASTAVTPVWGTTADIWGCKPIILIALCLFLVGSLLCGLAPSLGAPVAGRVVQGVGSSGMGTMVNTIICDSFSLKDRSLYLATTSGVWAIGSAVGPIIGGALRTRLE
jgi:hypothetical protein